MLVFFYTGASIFSSYFKTLLFLVFVTFVTSSEFTIVSLLAAKQDRAGDILFDNILHLSTLTFSSPNEFLKY